MKRLAHFTLVATLSLAILVAAVATLTFQPKEVSAITSAQLTKKAEAYCAKKSKTKNRYGNSPYSVCVVGYKAGYNGKNSKDSTCKNFLNIKSDCEKAYDAGKAAKKSSSSTGSGSSGTGSTGSGSGGSSGGTSSGKLTVTKTTTKNKCGGGSDAVQTSIDIGCRGEGNPLADLTFAIIRFLSMGVGLVITASFIWAGIQYIGSRGDPQAVALAKNRIQSNLLALFIYLFAYAILNYLLPGIVLK